MIVRLQTFPKKINLLYINHLSLTPYRPLGHPKHTLSPILATPSDPARDPSFGTAVWVDRRGSAAIAVQRRWRADLKSPMQSVRSGFLLNWSDAWAAVE